MILIGVDFGQQSEPSGICVVEHQKRKLDGRTVNHFVVRHLERLSIGSSFVEVAKRLSEITRGIRQRGTSTPTVYVDVTGLGEAIIDMIRQETSGSRKITPVRFTYGDQMTHENGQVRLGKAYLVTRLQTLLQTGCLHLPDTSEARALAKELLAYEIRIEKDANQHEGAFRVGSRDELVTALGMAVHKEPRFGGVY